METRANKAGVKKGRAKVNKTQELTNPGTSAVLEEGEIPTSKSFSGNSATKRKALEGKDPSQKPNTSKGIYSSTSLDSSDRSTSTQRIGNLRGIELEMEKEKLDQMYQWFQQQQKYQGSCSSSRTHRRSRSRSRSRGSRSPSNKSYSSRRSRSPSRRSYSSHRSRRSVYSRASRKEHELSSDSRSVSPSSGRNIADLLQSSLNGPRSVNSAPPELQRSDVDPLEERINSAVKECAPKPVMGPPISQKIGTLMDLYVSKPEFAKVMKLSEKYPRPENVPSLSMPDVPQDVDKTVDQKVIKEDKRLRHDQMCTSASLSCLGGVLDIIREEKGTNPKLIKAGEMVLDSITMLGFVHNDFSAIRLKSFKQTVNPSYVDVFSSKPEEPGMLMGKAPISEQVKSLDELNKLKAKLKKPDPNANTAKGRDFRKRGEVQKPHFRNPRGYAPRRRDDRRQRYFSPKGNYRKNQQDLKSQEDKKGPIHRKN